MKTQNNLEKILSSVKNALYRIWLFFLLLFSQYYRVGIFLALSGYLADRCVGEAKGDIIEIRNRGPPVTPGACYVNHILGATEGFENIPPNGDWYFSNDPSYNKLQIYSVNNNCDPNKLSKDARGINSTTTYDLELVNSGFSGSTTNFLQFTIMDSNNIEWKNIFLGDANNSENPVADIKYVVYTSGNFWNGYPYGDIQLGTLQGTQTGVYDRRKIIYFNHADLNRDRKVNGLDFAILGNEWGKSNATDPNRFGGDVGKDVNDLEAYADIDRSGTVDSNDIGLFATEWLWDANDPNTW